MGTALSISGLALAALALLVACGGDSDKEPSASSDTRGPSAAPSASAAAGNICDLLPGDDIKSITGIEAGQRLEHNGPGFLHFCTIYLKVEGCDECALSLEDLGTIDPNSYNGAASFRQTLIDTNADAGFTFDDGVLGDNSWLGTASAGAIPGFKVLYFTVGETAYDLDSARTVGGAADAGQMAALARAVVNNAQ